MSADSNSPFNEAAVLAQADWLFRTERFHEAEEILRKWLMTSRSPSATVQAVLAQAISLQPGRYSEALVEARKAIGLDPSKPIGFYVLAMILMDGEPKAALDALAEALRLAPDRPAFHALQARIYLRMKQPKQSLEAVETARRLAPENVECIQIHAVALLHNSKARQAREVIQNGLRLDPENATVHNALGWTLLRQGESDLARLHFAQALRLQPKMKNARDGLSHALKARYPLYRWIFGFWQWFQEQSRVRRRTTVALTILAGMILFPVIVSIPVVIATYVNMTLAWICLGLGTLLMVAILSAPLSLPVFDLFLRFDPYGRLVMTKEQIWATNWMVAGFICTVLAIVEVLVSSNGWDALGVFLAGMVVAGVVIGWPWKR